MFKLLCQRKYVKLYLASQVSLLATEVNVDNLLTTHLNIDRNVVKSMKQACRNKISKIPKEKLIQNCMVLKKLNVNVKKLEYLDCCLVLSPRTVRTRILILKEMGVKDPTFHHIYRFSISMNRSLKQFKQFHSIPAEENIMQTVVNNIGLKIKIINLNEFDSNIQASEFYTLCMVCFKALNFDLYHKVFYRNRKRRYQSFHEFRELLNIFQTKYHFDNNFLSKHPYLLEQDKNNIENFLTELEDIGLINNQNIIELVRKYPRILCYPIDKVKAILIFCKNMDIPINSSITNILRLSKEEFFRRYVNILYNYELCIWSTHPQILKLIYTYNTVVKRLEYLRRYNRTMIASIHTYLTDTRIFIRHVRGDILVKYTKKLVTYIFSKGLGNDTGHLLQFLKKHKHWRSVPLLSIAKTINYLRKYYSVEDICENIHIVLYTESAVSETLGMIEEKFSSNEGYHFTSSQCLALCLYLIEKRYHFSGDAVSYPEDSEALVTSPNHFEEVNINGYKTFVQNLVVDNRTIHDLNSIAWLEYLLR